MKWIFIALIYLMLPDVSVAQEEETSKECDCTASPISGDILQVAFVAKVTEVRPHYGQRLHATIEVEKVWGAAYEGGHSLYTVYTKLDTCYFPFEAGKTYLIDPHYLTERAFATDQCSGTKPIEQAELDLEVLGEPRTVFDQTIKDE